MAEGGGFISTLHPRYYSARYNGILFWKYAASFISYQYNTVMQNGPRVFGQF
jgi:hypothetical protein